MVTKNENSHDGKSGGERIAKVIARSGLCSRREAEALIEEGRVSVNGAVIESAALDILPSDKVLADGKPLPAREPPRLWRYHKPKGRVTTHKDPEGRPTVFEALPGGLPRLISVGRLDFNTEGLLLLTNDGDLARHMELPSTGWTRRYRVRAHGQISEEQLQELADGVTINRINYGPIEASLQRGQGGNVWIAISIREGKNREVRRIMEHLGLTVNRLIRVSFGPFMLGELEPGQIEEVKTSVLKDQLGPRLSRQLGVRREPVREERQLAPKRAKPTYLRRKPAAFAARPEPAREGEDRPLKRRRILQEGGSEAPRFEVVEEKPQRFRPGGEAGRADKPGFRKRETGREGGYEQREPRFQKDRRGGEAPRFEGERRQESGGKFKSRDWKPRETGPAGEQRSAEGGDAPRFRKFREEGRGGESRPHHRSGDFAERPGEGAGGAPRFRKSGGGAGGGRRVSRRFEASAEGAGEGGGEGGRFKKFREGARSGQRPPRRFETSAEDAAGRGGDRPRFKKFSGGAGSERPRPRRRFEEGRADGAPEARDAPRFRKFRGVAEGGRPRPARRFEAGEEGAPNTRGPREDRAGGQRRPYGDKGGRKPFKPREDSQPSFPRKRESMSAPETSAYKRRSAHGDSAADSNFRRGHEGGGRADGRPHRQGGKGKPFAGKPPHKKHGGGPRKPRPGRGPRKERP